MNTPTDAERGFARFAPKPKRQRPKVDLNDVDQTVDYISRFRAKRRLLQELSHVPTAVLPQVVDGYAQRHPDAALRLLLDHLAVSRLGVEAFTANTVETVLAAADDVAIDEATRGGGWLFHQPATQRRVLERLATLDKEPPPFLGHWDHHMWSQHAATLMAAEDPDLLAQLSVRGCVNLAYALRAAARVGLALHRLMPAPPNPDAFLNTFLNQDGPAHDADVTWLAEHADLLGDRPPARSRCSVRLSREQRVALLKPKHPRLAAHVAQAWGALARGEAPTDEERDLLRLIADTPGGHVVVADLVAGDQVQVVGSGWAAAWLAGTSEIEAVAARLSSPQLPSALTPRWYVAVGERLTESSLADWIAQAGDRRRSPLLERIGVDGLAANLDGFTAYPNLLVELPGIPAALGAVDVAPSWAATLVASALGESPVLWEAGWKLVENGFNGSFRELRVAVFGSGHAFERRHGYADLTHALHQANTARGT